MILYCLDPTSMPKWVTFLNGSYNLNSVTHRVEKETKQDQCWLVLSRTQSSKSGVIRVSKDFHLVPTCSQHTNRPLEIPVEYRDTEYLRCYTFAYDADRPWSLMQLMHLLQLVKPMQLVQLLRLIATNETQQALVHLFL